MAIWYISPRFGILNKEKSGNPAFRPFSVDFFATVDRFSAY
jgi:hypothetical protein